MFTGIIEETGTVSSVQKTDRISCIKIKAKLIFDDLNIGDSVAVSGVCLTVTKIQGEFFFADVMNETLSRSSLEKIRAGDRVNLERAVSLNRRLGGHIVTGHIDGTGTISAIRKDGIAVRYTVSADRSILRYIVEKGSVAVDGISLTVTGVTGDDFSVSVIPHTLSNTILPEKNVGSVVNIENDVIGKYVEKFLNYPETDMKKNTPGSITESFLQKYGY